MTQLPLSNTFDNNTIDPVLPTAAHSNVGNRDWWRHACQLVSKSYYVDYYARSSVRPSGFWNHKAIYPLITDKNEQTMWIARPPFPYSTIQNLNKTDFVTKLVQSFIWIHHRSILGVYLNLGVYLFKFTRISIYSYVE